MQGSLSVPSEEQHVSCCSSDAEMKKKEIAEYDESLSRIESMFENR